MFLKKGADKTVIDAHSVPCFEFCLLMHYYYTTAPMSPKDIENFLKSKLSISDYKKGGNWLGLKSSNWNGKGGFFEKLQVALENSDKSVKAIKEGEESSYTKIGVVVKEMYSIQEKMQSR